MKDEFVNYNQALALKELGFDEPCLMYIDDEEDLINDDTAEWLGAVKAPLKQQVFRWFREKHNFIGVVGLFSISNQGISSFEFHVDKIHYIGPSNFQEFVGFKTYEEAESACIDKLIEILKEK